LLKIKDLKKSLKTKVYFIFFYFTKYYTLKVKDSQTFLWLDLNSNSEAYLAIFAG